MLHVTRVPSHVLQLNLPIVGVSAPPLPQGPLQDE